MPVGMKQKNQSINRRGFLNSVRSIEEVLVRRRAVNADDPASWPDGAMRASLPNLRQIDIDPMMMAMSMSLTSQQDNLQLKGKSQFVEQKKKERERDPLVDSLVEYCRTLQSRVEVSY